MVKKTMKQTDVQTTPDIPEPQGNVEEQYEANVKILARDLLKASFDVSVAFERKYKDVLQDIADQVDNLIE